MDRGDRNANADREDVLVFGVALMIIDEDEAARIRQAFDIHDRIDALEGRQNHRVLELELVLFLVVAIFVDLGEMHFAFFDLRYFGVSRPVDVAITHF